MVRVRWGGYNGRIMSKRFKNPQGGSWELNHGP